MSESTETTEAAEPQTYGFNAEVRQLLDLVIHSLYSDRDVFLRELISNASDALDKARVACLQDASLRAAAGEPGIDIRIDPIASTLTISDNGIGLTSDEAREHLGTIASSGTKAFAKALKEDSEHNLIGQFGVGFYAALMVSDQVTVISRSAQPEAEPMVWACDGSTEYTLAPAERPDRGTDVILKLREDAFEYLDAEKLSAIVKRYSEFVSYPIRVNEEQVNEPKALWTRKPQDVEDSEYVEFYKQTSHDWADPATWLHIHADAPVQYKALLYVPAMVPMDMNYSDGRRPLKLYARRVLILEEARELLPEWLRFVRGVVDSEDLQLNVSRELVQQNLRVRELRHQLISRVLRHLKQLAKKEPDEYAAIWKDYGSTLKEGFAKRPGDNDPDSTDKLTGLVRFHSTRFEGPDEQVSFAEYVEAMPEGQDTIWYLTGTDYKTVARSPHLEGFKKKGYEVLLLTDPVDEWVVQSLTEFDGKPLKAASRGDLDEQLEDVDEEQHQGLLGWLKEVLASEVKDVRISARLTSSASVLVDDEHGMSANMQRILQQVNQGMPAGQRVLEINPDHALVRSLASLHGAGRAEQAQPLAMLLVDQARLTEGHLTDPAALVERLQVLSELAAAGLGSHAGPVLDHPVAPEATTVLENQPTE